MQRDKLLKLPTGFDRDLKLLLFSMASRRIVMGFLQVVRAIYYALIGFSPITIGLLLSISTFVSALHHISFGVLSDKYGRKPFLLLGALFATSRLVFLSTTRNFWLLVLGEGLGAMGEGAGAGQPVVSGYISDKVEISKRVSIFSTLAISNAVTTSIGSAIAGFPQVFEKLLGLELVRAHLPLFMIGVLFSALSFFVILPIKDVHSLDEKPSEERKGGFNVKSWSVILKFSLVRSTGGLGWGLIESMLTLYFFIRFSVGSDVLGPIYAASRFLSIFTYLLIPYIVAKIGDIGTITGSRIVSAIITFSFALTNSFPMAAALLLIFRISMMFSMPVRQTFATGLVDPEEIATAIGISNFARMGVRSVAPTLAGYMFEVVSLSLPFMLGSMVMALNGGLYYILFRPKKQSST